MIEALVIVYILGAIVVLFVGFGEVAREPTAHGQGIIIPYVLGAALIWPLIAPYLVFCWVYYQITGKAWGD